MAKAHIYYATDTYCVWCWGIGPALRDFAKRCEKIAWVDVIPGSMLVGDRIAAVGDKKDKVKESATRVGQLCKVEFGDGFFNSVEAGSIRLDSGLAARLFCAARQLSSPERGLEIAHQLQYLWYWEGKDLADPLVQRELAQRLNLDADKLLELRDAPEIEVARLSEVARRDTLPIKGYPTLLLEMPDGTCQRFGAPTSSADRLEFLLRSYLAGENPVKQPDELEED